MENLATFCHVKISALLLVDFAAGDVWGSKESSGAAGLLMLNTVNVISAADLLFDFEAHGDVWVNEDEKSISCLLIDENSLDFHPFSHGTEQLTGILVHYTVTLNLNI